MLPRRWSHTEGLRKFLFQTTQQIKRPKSKFSTLICGAIAAHKAAIRRNHGIKRKDIAELFIPLGLEPTRFSETLLIQLDKLGSRRGDHVHQSSKVSLPSIRDPFDDELKDIQFLVAELGVFDEVAQKIR